MSLINPFIIDAIVASRSVGGRLSVRHTGDLISSDPARLYLRGSKKMLFMYSLAFSIRAGSFGLSLRKSSSIAASGVAVLSLSMVADMAGSTSLTHISSGRSPKVLQDPL